MEKLDLHFHHEPDSGVMSKLDQILTQQRVHTHLLEQLMSRADEANARLDRINDATNNIAADIRSLKVEPGMTQAEADALNARLESTATALEAIAAETPDVPPTT